MRTTPRREPLLFAGIAVAAAAIASVAVLRHRNLRTGGDLALFEQAVWHLGRLERPRTTVFLDLPWVWGDHLHPVIASWAPLHALVPRAETLLLAQVALVCGAAVPVFAFARDRLDGDRRSALALAAAYLGWYGVANGATFDVHEFAFAPLLVALCALWGERERWRRFAVAFVLLLLTKEDLALLGAALGGWLALRGHRRAGAAAVGAGVGWYVVATEAVIPALSGGVEFRYWSYGSLGSGPLDVLLNAVRDPLLLPEALTDPAERPRALLAVVGSGLGLAFLSPLALPLGVLLLERFLSDVPNHWRDEFHYGLPLAPLLFMGAADALGRRGRVLRRLGAGGDRAARGLAVAVLGASLLLSLPRTAVRDLADATLYERSPHEALVLDALARIPAEDAVAAQWELMPHLARRDELFSIRATTPPDVEWIVFDVRTPSGDPAVATRRAVLAARRARYRTVVARDGLVVLRRR